MNGELIAVLEYMQREKGIDKMFLLGIETPAAQVAGVKLDLSHDFSLCNGP